MNRRIHWLVTVAVALAFAFPRTAAFAQAAAEAAMVGSASATATAKTGTAMGSGLNQAFGRLGGKVSQTTSQPAGGTVTHVHTHAAPRPVKSTAAPAGTATAQGPMIASIQTAGASCPPPNQAAAATPGKTGPAPANCGQNAGSMQAAPKYQSVITLPPSK
jgi:hypothetical protein